MNIRTKGELQSFLYEDSSWRKMELSTLKSLVHASKGRNEHTLIRASITMLYSHWEGHVKKAGEIYIHYLNSIGVKYSDMTINNVAVGMFEIFGGEFPAKKIEAYIQSSDFAINCLSNNFCARADKLIVTKSNLNTEVLDGILSVIGLDKTEFSANKVFIDERLLAYRNMIAHGERTDKNSSLKMDKTSYYELHNVIVKLITYFDDSLLNHVVRELFKKNTANVLSR